MAESGAGALVGVGAFGITLEYMEANGFPIDFGDGWDPINPETVPPDAVTMTAAETHTALDATLAQELALPVEGTTTVSSGVASGIEATHVATAGVLDPASVATEDIIAGTVEQGVVADTVAEDMVAETVMLCML